MQDSETFVRLHLHGGGEVLVDIAIDAAASHPPIVSIVGPTFDPGVLAEMLRTFDRFTDDDLPTVTEDVNALQLSSRNGLTNSTDSPAGGLARGESLPVTISPAPPGPR